MRSLKRSPGYSIFDFSKNKNLFWPIWIVVFCKNIFVLRYSYMITNFKDLYHYFNIRVSICTRLSISRLHFATYYSVIIILFYFVVLLYVFINCVVKFIKIHIFGYWPHIFVDFILWSCNCRLTACLLDLHSKCFLIWFLGFLNFLIIGLCNYSAHCWFLKSVSVPVSVCVANLFTRVAANLLSKNINYRHKSVLISIILGIFSNFKCFIMKCFIKSNYSRQIFKIISNVMLKQALSTLFQ